ncbi:PAS domain-containing protein [Ferrovibrio sp.]|uniref:PAS domain-containing protein n=1 Tax=Ferrovibrio sp. TaxID=1917215 RepID=UPI002618B92D|nr:PAS domain-containing protein [Ferrovibrio sp.]
MTLPTTLPLPHAIVAATGGWPEIRDPGMHGFLRCWAQWRQPAPRFGPVDAPTGRLPPRRRDIDPIALRHCLPHLWIFRIDPDLGNARLTLAGEEILFYWGRGIIGNDVFQLWGDDAVAQASRDSIVRCAATPAIIHGQPSNHAPKAHGLRVERLMLPLMNDDGAPFGVIGYSRFERESSWGETMRPRPSGRMQVYPLSQLPDLPPD